MFRPHRAGNNGGFAEILTKNMSRKRSARTNFDAGWLTIVRVMNYATVYVNRTLVISMRFMWNTYDLVLKQLAAAKCLLIRAISEWIWNTRRKVSCRRNYPIGVDLSQYCEARSLQYRRLSVAGNVRYPSNRPLNRRVVPRLRFESDPNT